jgi:hypothetical protein
VSGLQLVFAAQAAGAIEMPAGLADQLRVLLARATGHVAQPRIMGGLSLVS